MFSLETQNIELYDGLLLDAQIEMRAGQCYQLTGENGVGKSSFIEYLKNKQLAKEQEHTMICMDQFPLAPLNHLSVTDLFEQLENYRREELVLYREWRSLIQSFEHHSIKSLSGGQNQLVKILLCLFISGDLFVFDEPFHFLDKKNKEYLMQIFKVLKAMGKVILIIEHEDFKLNEIVDTMFEMRKEEGRLVIREGQWK